MICSLLLLSTAVAYTTRTSMAVPMSSMTSPAAGWVPFIMFPTALLPRVPRSSAGVTPYRMAAPRVAPTHCSHNTQ